MVCANSGAHDESDCEKAVLLFAVLVFDGVITSPSSGSGQLIKIDYGPQRDTDGSTRCGF